MRIGPFSKYEQQSGSQIECQVRTRVILAERFSLRTVLKTDAGFQSASEKSSTLVAPPQMRAKFCPSSPEKKHWSPGVVRSVTVQMLDNECKPSPVTGHTAVYYGT
jgi:hypothetical protein